MRNCNSKKDRKCIGQKDRQYIGQKDRQYIGQKDRQYIGQRDRQYIGQKDRQYIGQKNKKYIGQNDRQYIGQNDRQCIGQKDRQYIGQQGTNRQPIDNQTLHRNKHGNTNPTSKREWTHMLRNGAQCLVHLATWVWTYILVYQEIINCIYNSRYYLTYYPLLLGVVISLAMIDINVISGPKVEPLYQRINIVLIRQIKYINSVDINRNKHYKILTKHRPSLIRFTTVEAYWNRSLMQTIVTPFITCRPIICVHPIKYNLRLKKGTDVILYI